VTARRVIRLAAVYAAVAVAGIALAVFSENGHLQAFGLGLVLPGGGFLAHYDLVSAAGLMHLAAAVAGLCLFVLACGLWFATGNVVAPPLVWLGAALWAASMPHGRLMPQAVPTAVAIVSLSVVITLVATTIRQISAGARRVADNRYLETARYAVSEDDDPFPEMTPEHLARLRFALDRALQPAEGFGGFERLDEFQTAATRYQINFLAYGIALSHARFTPALAGYMQVAQRRMIEKQAQARVWAYWKLENLWGNLKLDAHPVGRENIMYTGFVALQMALFAATTGRDDFARPGGFALQGGTGLSQGDFVARLDTEATRSPFTLVACEPNWIYPLCNTIGFSAVKALEPARWEAMRDTFLTALDTEFLDYFGRFVPCRSARLGLALPAVGGAMPLAMPCVFLNALEPAVAERQWHLLRRRLFDRRGRFSRAVFWPIDTGNYGFSRASAYTAVAFSAAELGDREVHDACLAALEAECPSLMQDGVIHRRRASVWAHGVELMARATVRDSFRNLIEHGLPKDGPRLEIDDYPRVLVASAHRDGGGLRCVLHGHGEATLRVTGLTPGAGYRLTAGGGVLLADDEGEVRFPVTLDGRTPLRLVPEL
jgi:hypothetical protein